MHMPAAAWRIIIQGSKTLPFPLIKYRRRRQGPHEAGPKPDLAVTPAKEVW